MRTERYPLGSSQVYAPASSVQVPGSLCIIIAQITTVKQASVHTPLSLLLPGLKSVSFQDNSISSIRSALFFFTGSAAAIEGCFKALTVQLLSFFAGCVFG